MATPEQAARDLALLGARLKTAGPELRKDLLREVRTAGKPTVASIKQRAAEVLPRRGGLAARVAAQSYGVRTRLGARSAGVRIVGAGRTVRGLRAIDQGTVRHPVYGNREGLWVSQPVRPGFFTDPIMNDLPRFRDSVEEAIEETAQRVVRGI